MIAKLLFVLGCATLVVGLYALARWARKRNQELKAEFGTLGHRDAPTVFRQGNLRAGFRLFYFGDLPPRWAKVGRALLVAVGVVVALFLALVLVGLTRVA